MNHRHTRWLAIILLGLAVLINVGMAVAQVSANYDLHWNVLSSGGGSHRSTNYTINDSLGQWVNGSSTSADYQVVPGFGAGIGDLFSKLFLPIVLRY
jgi:hypothetical protein